MSALSNCKHQTALCHCLFPAAQPQANYTPKLHTSLRCSFCPPSLLAPTALYVSVRLSLYLDFCQSATASTACFISSTCLRIYIFQRFFSPASIPGKMNLLYCYRLFPTDLYYVAVTVYVPLFPNVKSLERAMGMFISNVLSNASHINM